MLGGDGTPHFPHCLFDLLLTRTSRIRFRQGVIIGVLLIQKLNYFFDDIEYPDNQPKPDFGCAVINIGGENVCREIHNTQLLFLPPEGYSGLPGGMQDLLNGRRSGVRTGNGFPHFCVGYHILITGVIEHA